MTGEIQHVANGNEVGTSDTPTSAAQTGAASSGPGTSGNGVSGTVISGTATPVERVEALFDELVLHYEEGNDRELRAAAKILLVALDKFRTHGGPGWATSLEQYCHMARYDPERFARVLQSNRHY